MPKGAEMKKKKHEIIFAMSEFDAPLGMVVMIDGLKSTYQQREALAVALEEIPAKFMSALSDAYDKAYRAIHGDAK